LVPDSPLSRHRATARELQARLAATQGGSPFLVLRDPSSGQSLVALNGLARLTIGRRPENDVALPWDSRASRLHAELVRLGEDWVVSDDGLSTNGTWVGDRRIAGRHRLRDGDLIRVGNTIIAFCAPREAQATTLLDEPQSLPISPAQRRVLVALCRPFLETGALAPPTNAHLAQELFLSIESVKSHLTALFERFGIERSQSKQKRSELIERAVRTGSVGVRDLIGSDASSAPTS
jgi:pSer/pThr/pTyr-binding forkhead associated (FHA) protein